MAAKTADKSLEKSTTAAADSKAAATRERGRR